MSNELINEIEESMKRERLEKFWQEYGSYVIAAVILAVLLTAVITGWRNWDAKTNAAHTAAVIEALEQEDQVTALAALAGDLRPSQKAVAYITAAGLLASEGQAQEALAHYKTIAADSAIDPVFRDLAQLMAVRLEWSIGAGDMDTESQLAALKPVRDSESSPWKWHAHIQTAVILAHAYNDFAQARAHLANVTGNENLPPSLRERAGALDHVYGLKMAQAEQAPDPAVIADEEPEG